MNRSKTSQPSQNTEIPKETSIDNTDSPRMESGQNITAEQSCKKKNSGLSSFLITLLIVITGTILVAIFNNDIKEFGMQLMERYGQERIDIVLYLISAVSCTPIMLPVWFYVMTGAAMGYSILHLCVVLALGSATGSLVTYALGRYFGKKPFIRKRFPNAHEHPWIQGKSKWIVTVILFFGTASPIPCDVFYFACGVKRYPVVPFFLATLGGRFVRYLYLGYGFETITSWLS